MKKSIKSRKLQLNAETVRRLADTNLVGAAGAKWGSPGFCFPTLAPEECESYWICPTDATYCITKCGVK